MKVDNFSPKDERVETGTEKTLIHNSHENMNSHKENFESRNRISGSRGDR